MFDPLPKLLLGLVTGIGFGFLLQKGRVAKFEVIVGQFLLRDWTVVKIMTTAVLVGSVGIYAMAGDAPSALHVKPFAVAGVLLGGTLFGIGMALFGYCPGTSVAACGEGRRDAMVGVVGMLLGAGAYVAAYPWLEPVIQGLGNAGKITFPELTGTAPWPWIAGLAAAVAVLVWLLESWGRPRSTPLVRGEPSGRPRRARAGGQQ